LIFKLFSLFSGTKIKKIHLLEIALIKNKKLYLKVRLKRETKSEMKGVDFGRNANKKIISAK
jgi:hypothetical protein